jgi:hypothetical protein
VASETSWRPLGIDSDEEIAEYDALHDGIPEWMYSALWEWVRSEITIVKKDYATKGSVQHLDRRIVEPMLQIRIPDVRNSFHPIRDMIITLQDESKDLQIVDYILAHSDRAKADKLEEILTRCKSAWAVGSRSGKRGLVRRIPLGVQVGVDSVIERAGRAGKHLAKAWENLYGIQHNISEAYRLAILAVEDAAIPRISPSNERATLGTVLRDLENQGDWSLPMTREHEKAPSKDVLIGMIRLLWHGQHDRHGGQVGQEPVSEQEAIVAIGLATTLVHWFDAGIVLRSG